MTPITILFLHATFSDAEGTYNLRMPMQSLAVCEATVPLVWENASDVYC